MEMPSLVLLLSLALLPIAGANAAGQSQPGQATVDPSGWYEYVPPRQRPAVGGGAEKSGAGYSGQVKVKLVAPDMVNVDFYVNKGAPSYNSGSFVATLPYQTNVAVYEPHDIDPSCKITFVFNATAVTVEEAADDLNAGCGFGHAVVADGRYQKRSPKIKKRVR